MSRRRVVAVAIAVIAAGAAARVQRSSPMDVLKVRGQVYLVAGPVSNALVQVKTTNMRLNPRPINPGQLLYPCESVVEIADQKRGAVPHYLPGENPFLKSSATNISCRKSPRGRRADDVSGV